MNERSSHRATERPGRADVWHLERVYPSTNRYGLPDVPAYFGPIPDRLNEYRKRIDGQAPAGAACHFYLEDYRFESVWFRSEKAWQYIRRYKTVLMPDFSIGADYPQAVNIMQLYRARWCCQFWRGRGIAVIPSMTWAAGVPYDLTFASIAPGGAVAVGTVGVADWRTFEHGYRAMLEHVRPSIVLVYGSGLPFKTSTPMRRYKSRWEIIRNGDEYQTL